MRGWFDAFRTDGGPTLYSYANRTAVTGDPLTVTLCAVSLTILTAFLIIFPGVRKERFATFVVVVLSLLVGTTLLITNYGSSWHSASGEITSVYRSFSGDKLNAYLGVNIGLNSVNVTLRALPTHNRSEEIDFNERFYWIKPREIQEEYRGALVKGLPYPILTVAEYFTIDAAGFCWGRHYRQAGYYAHILLWSSFAFWILSCILLCVVPRYGAYAMVIVGLLMLMADALYYWLLPARPLVIPFENVRLSFTFGWCYWLSLSAGAASLITGCVIAILDILIPHKFSHILEVDYGTAFDRHIIIEEQKYRRQKFNTLNIPKLEEPLGEVGSRILRRLSTRLSRRPDDGGQPGALGLSARGGGRGGRFGDRLGVDNSAFETASAIVGLEPPKPSWESPHLLHAEAVINRKSPKSVSFRSDMKPKLARLSADRPPSESSTGTTTADEGPIDSVSSSDPAALPIHSSTASTTLPTESGSGSSPLGSLDPGASSSTPAAGRPQLQITAIPPKSVLKKTPSTASSSVTGEPGRRESDQSTSSSVVGLAGLGGVVEAEIAYNDEEEDFKSMRKGKRGSDVSQLSINLHPMPDVDDRRGSRGSITTSIKEMPGEDDDSEEEEVPRW